MTANAHVALVEDNTAKQAHRADVIQDLSSFSIPKLLNCRFDVNEEYLERKLVRHRILFGGNSGRRSGEQKQLKW